MKIHPSVLASANPDAVAVVGFYRTGTHWLCRLIQEYFGRLIVNRGRNFGAAMPPWGFFHHDALRRMGAPRQVVYLYRDPVDTMFSWSQMLDTWEYTWDNIRSGAEEYGKHLAHWLAPGYAGRLAAVRYECMREDFPRICLLVDQEVDGGRLDYVLTRAAEERRMTTREHNRKWVFPLGPEYASARAGFRSEHTAFVWETVLAGREWLRSYFDHLPEEKQWTP